MILTKDIYPKNAKTAKFFQLATSDKIPERYKRERIFGFTVPDLRFFTNLNAFVWFRVYAHNSNVEL